MLIQQHCAATVGHCLQVPTRGPHTYTPPAHQPRVVAALTGKQKVHCTLMVCPLLWREGRVGGRVVQGYVGGYACVLGWLSPPGRMLTLQGYHGSSNSQRSNNNNNNNNTSQETPANLCILCSGITVAPAKLTNYINSTPSQLTVSREVFRQALSIAALTHIHNYIYAQLFCI